MPLIHSRVAEQRNASLLNDRRRHRHGPEADGSRKLPEPSVRRSVRQLEDAMLRDDQIAMLCDIGQSIAFADDSQGEIDTLIREGYVAKDGDLYELPPKAEKVLLDRGAGLNEACPGNAEPTTSGQR